MIVNDISDDSQSTFESLKVGIPQGSILGRLLFLIYVNDITKVCEKCDVTVYADDTILYYSSKTAHLLQDQLNSDLFFYLLGLLRID